MRKIGLWIALALVGLGVWPQTTSARLTIGLSSVNIAFLPIYLAQEKGLFK